MFVKPYESSEGLEHFGTPCNLVTEVCPFCDGDFVETDECSICGEYIENKFIATADDELICEDCYTMHSIFD